MPRADTRSYMISCYGDEEDRLRLLLIAEAAGTSMSGWLVGRIREAFTELHGDADPAQLLEGRDLKKSWGNFSTKGKVNA